MKGLISAAQTGVLFGRTADEIRACIDPVTHVASFPEEWMPDGRRCWREAAAATGSEDVAVIIAWLEGQQ